MNIYTDYSYLFNAMFGKGANNKASQSATMKLSDLSSRSGQAQLRAAGIDVNSNQYKAALKAMQSAGKGAGAAYVNIQGIKNLMSSFDKDGDRIVMGGPFAGIAGLEVNEANSSKRTKGYKPISDSTKEEMFETVKKEFLRGMWDGVETAGDTKRSEVYAKMYRNTSKNDRLAAGRTLQEYEKAYFLEFQKIAKELEPNHIPGREYSYDVRKQIESLSRADIDKTVALNSKGFSISV